MRNNELFNRISELVLSRKHELQGFETINFESEHIFRIGLDDLGRITLVYAGPRGSYVNPREVKFIDIQYRQQNDFAYLLLFSLVDRTFTEQFISLCYDLVSYIVEKDHEDIVHALVTRYTQWLTMFEKERTERRSKQEIKGLIGELIHLKDYMIPKYGANMSIKSWGGLSLNHKDFEIYDTWYEVKSVKPSSITVSISSLEQLDSNIDGKLCIHYIDEANETESNGITLSSIVAQIKDLLEDAEINMLNHKLIDAKYFNLSEYDDYIFKYIRKNFYIVNEQFPRIKKELIPNNDKVAKVSYDLIINTLNDFKLY